MEVVLKYAGNGGGVHRRSLYQAASAKQSGLRAKYSWLRECGEYYHQNEVESVVSRSVQLYVRMESQE